ncbi:MAG TPA: OmpA family protein [Devosia sp.]
MRLRNWLLTGTSLGLLALAPFPAQAQSAELTAAYQAYVAAQASGDAAATETALAALTEQCIVAGYSSIDECTAALAQAEADAAAAAAQAEADAAAKAEAEAAAQAEAEAAAAAAQAEAEAAAQAEAEAAAKAEAEAAARAEAEAAAKAEAEAAAQAEAEAAAQAEAEAAAAAQAEADAKAAAEAEAAAAAQAEADAANQQFVADLNAALAEYQAALDAAAGGGDYAAAQAQADAAAARILELCTANGYADIQSCIGQELPPLPQPPAAEEPALAEPAAEEPAAEAPAEEPAAEAPAEEPAVETPAEPTADQPAAETPAEQPAEPAVIEAPPPIDPAVQAQADIATAIELYNSGIAQLEAGNADGQVTVDIALQQITTACQTAGNADVAACLAAFGFPPLAEVPQIEVSAEPAPAPELSPAIDEVVTPDAVEALPVEIAPEEAAPLLDSAKDVQTVIAAGEPAPEPPAEQPTEPAAPPPTSDAEAQAKLAPVQVQSLEAVPVEQVIAEQPIALAPPPQEIQAAALPENVTIINNVTNITNNTTVINNNAPSAPVIFQIGVNIVINNPDQERDRMYRPDEDRIFYERLSNGRTKETIVRPNGVRIVTIRNRWGDVLKRSRITPDGREYILAYYDDEDDEDDRDGFFIDPGRDLPPLRLNIPARDYILDVEYADEEEVELFFRQPPVEQVRRIYSVEEVKRSSRIRDSVRRVEVGGLTFDSGKATISASQVGALSKVARAMLAVLDENPAETFLIEGHTDAVGSDASNLVLSDRRAAVVAQILTDFYKVPPENLVTQGYGERYLKVKTQAAEPLNRRVTIKRITSLITVADR